MQDFFFYQNEPIKKNLKYKSHVMFMYLL